MTLPKDANQRKAVPLATGLIDYFPDALVAIAELSRIGGQQHNPGQPLFWDRSKSTDHGDCLMRHFFERGTVDIDGVRHSTKVAWRALALLQTELEQAARAKRALQQLTALSEELGLYDGPSSHPMAAEALRDEYEKGDRETGL